MMTPEQEIKYYRDYLEQGIAVLCEAVGVNSERYDTDQADGECYLDCFKEMATLLKAAGVYYCNDDREFKQRESVADRFSKSVGGISNRQLLDQFKQ